MNGYFFSEKRAYICCNRFIFKMGGKETNGERRKTVKTLELLQRKDLHPRIGVPKSTVADWIEDFNIYIPKVKQRSVTYYKPEAIDVLWFIKQCSEKNYRKDQIMRLLAEEGFPIAIQESAEDIKKILEY